MRAHETYKPLQYVIPWSDFENPYSFLARIVQLMIVNLGSFLIGQSAERDTVIRS